jgi:iduronate 2-sulfatase
MPTPSRRYVVLQEIPSFQAAVLRTHRPINDFVNHFREVGPDWTTLPGLFKASGYNVVGAGKSFHPDLPPNNDLPYSWDDRMTNGEWDEYMYPTENACENRTAWCSTTDEADLDDFKTTSGTKELLHNVTALSDPWFVLAGFRKPHLQWRVPEHHGPLPRR